MLNSENSISNYYIILMDWGDRIFRMKRKESLFIDEMEYKSVLSPHLKPYID